MNNSNDTMGNRTRDLPAYNEVPQPTALPHKIMVVGYKALQYGGRLGSITG
jgi:hypothetical protein